VAHYHPNRLLRARLVEETASRVRGSSRAPVREWTGWRGPDRDGRVAWLPARLPDKPRIVWRVPLPSKGLGGVTATKDHVLVSGRELMDSSDVYLCLRADTGKEVWRHLNPATAEKELDYGNSPRASPLVQDRYVILTGAFGHLHCLELATGKVVWEKDLKEEFAVKDERKWGLCSSPLIADGRLILNPGGKDASLVAVEPATGKVLWKTTGKPASYGNFVLATLGGKKQIIGFDADSLGGWDVTSGKRLWRLVPERSSDFNVPTPLVVADRLLVAWENNGTFLYRFEKEGKIDPRPVARYDGLRPDSHTPVVTAGRVFGIWNGLHCLDQKKLTLIWRSRDPAFSRYGTLVASADRVLAITLAGELILFDPAADAFKPISRVKLLEDESGIHSHPAFVGTRMYLRGDAELLCVELNEPRTK
jgi:outer membrane protein assembly factor BamB